MTALVLAAGAVFAGGSPLRTLVVVNDDSDHSLEVGRYYAEARGIPDQNICHIVLTNRISMSTSVYSNQVEQPVLDYVAASGLSGQVDTVVFAMDIPHRVQLGDPDDLRWSGLTACMYYGFFNSPSPFDFGCQVAAGSEHDYFEAEHAFTRAGSPVSNRYYLSAMLTSSNLAAAKSLVRRSVWADGTMPPSRVVLLRTTDSDRWIQWKEFGETLFLTRFIDTPQEYVWLNANTFTGVTNLVGVTGGAQNFGWLGQNKNLPGGYADHLTSYGGYLFETKPEPLQMSILDWIYHGFSGSYGTVVEPCAFTNKFTSPRLHYWYGRGFSLGESHWMSVRNPYQGIFVGDPLCAPFARTPTAEWVGVTNGAVWSGTVTVTAAVSAADTALPVSAVDVWRDGRSFTEVTNISPAAGNTVDITINGSNRQYVVTGSDTVVTIASGVAALINTPPSLDVTARAYGDRVVIKRDALGVSADGWSCDAVTSAGTADVATLRVALPSTNFLDTAIPAREGLTLSGNAKAGDVVRATITSLTGGTYTNAYTVPSNGTSLYDIMLGLRAAILAETNLLDSSGCFLANITTDDDAIEGWLFARTNTWEGHNLFVDYEVDKVGGSTLSGPDFADNFNDNGSVQGGRATLFFSAGVTQLTPAITMDTTLWPDGPHDLTLSARDGSGVGTEGRATVRVVVDNHDLSCAITSPASGIYVFKTGVLTVDVATSLSSGTVTQLMVHAEGKPVYTGVTGSASVTLPLDAYGAGTLNLQGHAWADGDREAVSVPVGVTLYTDSDSDGVSDQWEHENFGSTTNYDGSADVDGDGCENVKEFIADTVPTNSASYPSVSAINSDLSVAYETSSRRQYRLRLADDLFDGVWTPFGPVVSGTGGTVIWTNMPPATNDVRFYAVEILLPE